jgi:hypothetical protein
MDFVPQKDNELVVEEEDLIQTKSNRRVTWQLAGCFNGNLQLQPTLHGPGRSMPLFSCHDALFK